MDACEGADTRRWMRYGLSADMPMTVGQVGAGCIETSGRRG